MFQDVRCGIAILHNTMRGKYTCAWTDLINRMTNMSKLNRRMLVTLSLSKFYLKRLNWSILHTTIQLKENCITSLTWSYFTTFVSIFQPIVCSFVGHRPPPLVHRFCGTIEGRLNPFFTESDKPGKLPWNTPPRPGVEPVPRRDSEIYSFFHDWLLPHR